VQPVIVNRVASLKSDRAVEKPWNVNKSIEGRGKSSSSKDPKQE